MRAVIQRVKSAGVKVEGREIASVGPGLLILLGIENEDQREEIPWLCEKITKLRIFNDENGAMNCSLNEKPYGVLVVSQFTLFASTRKGNRPSYLRAASPEKALPLYEAFLEDLQTLAKTSVQSGIFGAMMEVTLVNDGPVTIIIDTRAKE